MDNERKKLKQNEKILKVMKMDKDALLPTRATTGSAGLDLMSSENIIIKANTVSKVKTGICAVAPEGCYLRVAPRSGLALKDWIQIGAGVIDGDYRGEIGVVLINMKDKDFSVRKGDKIAQIICEKIEVPKVIEVMEMETTQRGDKGFGSTGIN
ncbi:deoxyuridine 5'-triphosphate nucleotidohydrolase-like [Tetranychus urticae]|uniref:Deoxyuridine 5'-triphosphate nucleotidohydrolase n=1 Tax=Tetranychus urticae TaxID=32264 RepID=T1KSP1_TETUR|nr:deoxyuridine 5'-triphosphate nucleotidohydrolase-like [Tetranychus urticae]